MKDGGLIIRPRPTHHREKEESMSTPTPAEIKRIMETPAKGTHYHDADLLHDLDRIILDPALPRETRLSALRRLEEGVMGVEHDPDLDAYVDFVRSLDT
jgi:hypothetical protein